MKKTWKLTGEAMPNEGKHARCVDEQFVHVVNKEVPTKAEKKAIRRKTRFLLVESIRILVITLFLFVVAAGDYIFFPFVIALATTVLLSLLEFEADDLE